MYTGIMVALGDAHHDNAPLNAALRLAKASAARLHVVHVRTERIADGHVDAEKAELLKVVDGASEELEESVSFELIQATDAKPRRRGVAQHLLEYAMSHAIDLIIMGTHARSPVARLTLGSVADGLIRGTDLPILLIPRKARSFDLRRILVALDGTPRSERIVEDAAHLAKLVSASIELMHVLQPRLLVTRNRSERFGAPPPFETGTLRGDRSNDYLEGIALPLEEQGIATTTSTFIGNQVAQLVKDEANAENADVIALVTCGRLPIGIRKQGVFDELIAGARCAVLVRRHRAMPVQNQRARDARPHKTTDPPRGSAR